MRVIAALALALGLAACTAAGDVASSGGGATAEPTSKVVTTGPSSVSSGASAATVSSSTTAGVAATATTVHPVRALGVEGSVYALERGGDLLEFVAATGEIRRWKVPERLRVSAAANFAVLPEGLAVYNRIGEDAVVYPYDGPEAAVEVPAAYFEGAALDVWAVSAEGEVAVNVYDGRGALRSQLSGPRPNRAGVFLIGDSLVDASLSRLDLRTGSTDEIAEGGLIALSLTHVAAQVCELEGSCTVTVLQWDGSVVGSATVAAVATSGAGSDPGMKQSASGPDGRAGLTSYAKLSGDGRFIVYGWSAKVTEPGEIRSFDLVDGSVRTLARLEGFPRPSAVSADGRHAVILPQPASGNVQLVAVDDPTRTASISFATNVLSVTAGPSMRPAS